MSIESQPAVQIELKSNPSTVQRILDNALEHFSNFGYKGASVREITQASQVTKPTLYYYFKNKEDLYVKLAHSCFERIYSKLEPASKIGNSVQERMINFLRAYVELCNSEKPVVKFAYLIGVSPERGRPDVGVAIFGRKVTALVDQIVEYGVKKGELPADKVQCISFTLNGLVMLKITSLLVGTRPGEDDSVAETCIKGLLLRQSAS